MISPENVDADNKKQTLSVEHWQEFVEVYEKEHEALSDDSVRDAVKSEFRGSKKRYDVFSAVKNAFSPTSDLTDDYGVATTGPLCDIEKTGADLLLMSKDINYISLCVVFCNAGASDYTNWGTYINRMKNTIEENKSTIKSRLGSESKSINAVQYVTALPAEEVADIDTTTVTRAINVNNYSIWVVDDDYIPPDSSDPIKQLKQSVGRIEDSELRAMIREGIDHTSSRNTSIEISPSISVRRILKEVTQALIQENKVYGEEEPKEFDHSEFMEKFINLCEVNDPCDRKEIALGDRADEVINQAERFDVITSASSRVNSSKDYRALCKGEGTSNIKQSVDEKIIKSKMPEKRAELAYDIADRRFTQTDSSGSELGDFS